MFKFKKAIAFCITLLLLVGCAFLQSSAASETQLKNEISALEQQSKQIEAKIKKLKAQNADQQTIADAIQSKINNIQQQIIACNNEIYKINNTIAANKAEIKRQNEEIEATKLTFKKRLRAIYMNNSNSTAQILLGADNFSNFLQLEQLTAAVSSHDRAIIEDIIAVIKNLEEKQKENEKLLENQVAIKGTIVAKQQELKAQQDEVQAIISSINSQTNALTNENKSIEAQIKSRQRDLDNMFKNYGTNSNVVYDGNGFYWPVPSCYSWTTYSGHTGIDIPGAYGAPIVASADGEVLTAVTGHGRNPNSSGLASYGNYVVIDHGNKGGVNYKTYSAHMSSVVVRAGQKVKQGQIIGYVGNSGRTFGRTGTHLHFELRLNNSYTHPIKYLRKK